MLTSAYPGGLFGDTDMAVPHGDPQAGYGDDPQAGYGAQPGYGAPPAAGGLPAYGGQRGYVADPGYGAGTVAARQWQLALSRPARKLVIFFIVFGAVLAIGASVANTALIGSRANAVAAANQVTADAAPVRSALDSYDSKAQACGNKLACVTALDRQTAATLTTFASQLRSISMPSKAAAADHQLIAAVSDMAAAFTKRGAATSVTQDENIIQAASLQPLADRLNTAYDNLGHVLGVNG